MKRTETHRVVDDQNAPRKKQALIKRSQTLAKIIKMERPAVEEPLLIPPPRPLDAYTPANWEFPSVITKPFNLEPDFLKVQMEFSLSKLVSAMNN